MRNSTLLLAQVDQHPHDETLWKAATDALMEDEELSYDEAMARVTHVVQTAITAADLARACGMVHVHSPDQTDALKVIGHALMLRHYDVPTIILVPGDQYPILNVTNGHTWWSPGHNAVVTVGGSWLCRWVDLWLSKSTASRVPIAVRLQETQGR